MSKKSKRALGFIGIIIGLIFIASIYSSEKTEASVGNWIKNIGMLTLAIWIISSSTIKLMMVAGNKVSWLNSISLMSFVMTIFLIVISQIAYSSPDNNRIFSFSEHITYALFLFGWPIIDYIDLATD